MIILKVLLIENSTSTISKDNLTPTDTCLVIETAYSAEEGVEMINKNEYDLVISDYDITGSNGIQFLKGLRIIGENVPIMILEGSSRDEEEKTRLLNEIFKCPEILNNPKIGKEKLLKKDIELLSKKDSLTSAFTEVWRFGNYVIKIKEGGIEKAEKRRNYQLKLREKLDFLPKYYGMLSTKSNDKEIIVNFYEYIEPLKPIEIKIGDLKKILEIVEKSYEQGYHGIDLKHSNFGKKDDKIYYLDEEGIGQYAPHDWTELLREFLDRISNRR